MIVLVSSILVLKQVILTNIWESGINDSAGVKHPGAQTGNSN